MSETIDLGNRPMKREIHVHIHGADGHTLLEWIHKLGVLEGRVNVMAQNQAELAAEMATLKQKITKINGETNDLNNKNTTLQQRVTALEAIIAAGGPLTPEVQQGWEEVKAAAQAVDDAVPDPITM